MQEEYRFQHSEIKFKKCPGCKTECTLLYDRHHDQHYSKTCGRIILESNEYLLDYPADPQFWTKLKEKREEVKTLKKIIQLLKEYEQEYQIKDNTIIIPTLTEKQYNRIDYLLEQIRFDLILDDGRFIITKE